MKGHTEESITDINGEPTHNWLDCYRIALDFGPDAARKAIENMDSHRSGRPGPVVTPSVQDLEPGHLFL